MHGLCGRTVEIEGLHLGQQIVAGRVADGQPGSGKGADLLLVDGDPLTNLNLIADPAKNFVVIMKDGKIYKNTLP